MLGIVLLKVVGGIGNKAAQLAAQQQVGHQVAIVVGRLIGARVADGEREGGVGRRQLHTDGYRLVRLIGLGGTHGTYGANEAYGTRGTFKEQPVGQYPPLVVEHREVVHTVGQLVCRQLHGDGLATVL